MQILSRSISALNVRESPKFTRLTGNRGRGTQRVTSDFRPEVKIRPFCACAMKSTQYDAHLWSNGRKFSVL